MEKICSNCSHWTREEESAFPEGKKYMGGCESLKFIYTGEGGTAEKDGVEYWDFDGYSAGFETGESFGCIHWEER